MPVQELSPESAKLVDGRRNPSTDSGTTFRQCGPTRQGLWPPPKITICLFEPTALPPASLGRGQRPSVNTGATPNGYIAVLLTRPPTLGGRKRKQMHLVLLSLSILSAATPADFNQQWGTGRQSWTAMEHEPQLD